MVGNHKPKVEKDSTERYLLTYGDLMNLLLIFFIILYSMSQVDSQKFEQLSASFKDTFGVFMPSANISSGGGGDSLIPLNPSESTDQISSQKTEQQQMDELKQEVSHLIENQGLKENINVTLEERGVVVSMTAKLLFKSGSAEIEPESVPVIDNIGKILLSLPTNHIRVEGHTDTDPIKTSLFPTNWELSSARATNVLRLLVEKSNVNPTFISAVGYGEFRPKFPNDTDANKSSNRRVDIVIVKSIYDQSESGKTSN